MMVPELLKALETQMGVDLDRPWKKLPARQRRIVLEGTGKRELTIHWERTRGSGKYRKSWEGLRHNITRRFRETASDDVRRWLLRYFSEADCASCDGERLNQIARAVRLNDLS